MALQLLARKQVDARALISHVMPLAEWRHAFEMFERKDGRKLVLQPVD
jgi:L-iditol 2-dehydrogenase